MPLPSISLADVKQGANKARSVGMAGFNSARSAVQNKSSMPSTSTGYRPAAAGAPPPPGSTNAKTYGPPPQRTGSGAGASASPIPRPSPARPPLPQRSTSQASPPPPYKRDTPPLPQGSGSAVSPPLPQRTGSAVLPPLPIRRNTSSVSQAPSPSPPPPPPPAPPAPRAAPPPTYRSRPSAATPSPPFAARTPSFASQAEQPEPEIEHIDWADLTPEDKGVFFDWLDEFFERYLRTEGSNGEKDQMGKVYLSPAAPAPKMVVHAPANRVVAPSPRVIAPAPSSRGPPKPNLATKPSSPGPISQVGSYQDDLQMSYPPASINDSQALDIAMYFHPQTPWTEAWYETTNTLPPPLQNNGDIRWRGSTMRTHAARTFSAGVLFADLSMCWFAVSSPLTPSDPNDTARVTRSVEYAPRPAPLDRDTLLAASAAYGELVAAFAEGFAGTGRHCARGECWDLAHHALEHAAAQLPGAPPVPSLSRTHGHLLFKGTPAAGRWRGGDDRVRRGDIVEWRRARVDLPGGAWATLGDPDHTAVVVEDAQQVRGERPGAEELGTLVVVEQSVGSPPERKSYPMRGFVQGEVWIYRPVGMEVYTGVRELGPTPPPGLQTMKI